MKAVIVFSGGMDSRTVLAKAVRQKRDCYAITMFYGQRHNKEIEYAKNVCDELGIRHKVVDLSFMSAICGDNSLTGTKPVPEGHYEANSMKDTVVPNRNMILLSIALAYAESLGAEEVWYGAHSGDHHIYPDCRPVFVDRMNALAKVASEKGIAIKAPYLQGNKHTILLDGMKLGVDYAKTWTCYNGREKACGVCGSCQERLEAFEGAGLVDPLEYENE